MFVLVTPLASIPTIDAWQTRVTSSGLNNPNLLLNKVANKQPTKLKKDDHANTLPTHLGSVLSLAAAISI